MKGHVFMHPAMASAGTGKRGGRSSASRSGVDTPEHDAAGTARDPRWPCWLCLLIWKAMLFLLFKQLGLI